MQNKSLHINTSTVEKTNERIACITVKNILHILFDRRLLHHSGAVCPDLGVYIDCDATYRARCHSASPRYVNYRYVKSFALYHRPLFRCCWWHWYTFSTGLWERCAGRPSSLPDVPTTVGPAAAFVLLSVNLRPYN